MPSTHYPTHYPLGTYYPTDTLVLNNLSKNLLLGESKGSENNLDNFISKSSKEGGSDNRLE